MSRVTFLPKLQGENQTLSFDFTSRMGVGETLSSATVTCTVYSGVDSNPSTMLVGIPSTSGNIVSQHVASGVTGVTYYLLCTAVTSGLQTLKLGGYLAVTPDAP